LKHEANKLCSKETNNLFVYFKKKQVNYVFLSIINYIQTNKLLLHGLSMFNKKKTFIGLLNYV